MERQKFVPTPGIVYPLRPGGRYQCLERLRYPHDAIMRNTASGWTLKAHGCGIYPDGTIDWDYSTGGHFEEDK